MQQDKERQVKTPGRNGFTYRELFGIIVLCDNARQQESFYNKLKSEGYRVKVVAV
ncbi:MAG: hypothetical protein H6R04_687 [Burkholderiaceae bacterium]|nr:hypothetical protein [Burkholderiaceae bacterium]